jgi:NAD-dependent oxidoreductase involved in siderophore biosynthesis
LVCEDTGTFDAVQRLDDPERLRRSRLNSECRLSCLQKTLDSCAAADRAVDIAQRALRSHDGDYPVCCHNVEDRSWFTAWSVIYELAGTPMAHVTCGPPCRSDYWTVDFDRRAK